MISGMGALGERLHGAPKAKLTGYELIAVQATARTVWLMVRLRTDGGLTGLGELSDGVGLRPVVKDDLAKLDAGLGEFFQIVSGRSPVEVERFRQMGRARAESGGVFWATLYSAMEQGLWDLTGQLLGVPVYELFGGKVRDRLPVYANINRATRPRTPEGFAASAKKAVQDGFGGVKLAPFDGFPKAGTPAKEVDAFVDAGVAAIYAVREAVGADVKVMVDCHSFFDVARSIAVAKRLEGAKLDWYEEPVAPELLAETVEIRRAIRQEMAGGEFLFGVKGFEPMCREKAVEVIMPDVKHCGGMLEMTHIAAMAAGHGVAVAPHNPTGPVATAASVQLCAGMGNFRILEMQWGEVSWRRDLLEPAERFEKGEIAVTSRAGLGVKLNEEVVRNHRF